MDNKGFYMMAGTVLTNLAMPELRRLLEASELATEINKGELKIEVKQQARIFFREGFDHEFILVGDAREREHLTDLLDRICAVLQAQRIAHSCEVYDRENNLIDELEFPS